MTAGGDTGRHLQAIVAPLLVHDLPVTVWWPGDPPFGTDAGERARGDGRPAGRRRLPLERRRPGPARIALAALARPALPISDFALMRQARWREAVASIFDRPELQPYLRSLRRIAVTYAAHGGPGVGGGDQPRQADLPRGLAGVPARAAGAPAADAPRGRRGGGRRSRRRDATSGRSWHRERGAETEVAAPAGRLAGAGRHDPPRRAAGRAARIGAPGRGDRRGGERPRPRASRTGSRPSTGPSTRRADRRRPSHRGDRGRRPGSGGGRDARRRRRGWRGPRRRGRRSVRSRRAPRPPRRTRDGRRARDPRPRHAGARGGGRGRGPRRAPSRQCAAEHGRADLASTGAPRRRPSTVPSSRSRSGRACPGTPSTSGSATTASSRAAIPTATSGRSTACCCRETRGAASPLRRLIPRTSTRGRSTRRSPPAESPAVGRRPLRGDPPRGAGGRRVGAPGLRRDPRGRRFRRPRPLGLPGQRGLRRARLDDVGPAPTHIAAAPGPGDPHARRARRDARRSSSRRSGPARPPSSPSCWGRGHSGPDRDERALPALRARRAGATWVLDAAAAAGLAEDDPRIVGSRPGGRGTMRSVPTPRPEPPRPREDHVTMTRQAHDFEPLRPRPPARPTSGRCRCRRTPSTAGPTRPASRASSPPRPSSASSTARTAASCTAATGSATSSPTGRSRRSPTCCGRGTGIPKARLTAGRGPAGRHVGPARPAAHGEADGRAAHRRLRVGRHPGPRLAARPRSRPAPSPRSRPRRSPPSSASARISSRSIRTRSSTSSRASSTS